MQNILPHFRRALCAHLGINVRVCVERLLCFQLLRLWNVSFKNVKSLRCSLFMLLYSRCPIPLFSLCNTQHPSFLYTAVLRHDKTDKCQRRVWVDGGLHLLPGCDRTVRHQLKGYMANQPRTWLRAATTTNQQCWWVLVLEALDRECVCVFVCHLPSEQMSLLPVILMYTNSFPWWLLTIVWHVPTKCLAARGQAHVLLPAAFFFGCKRK